MHFIYKIMVTGEAMQESLSGFLGLLGRPNWSFLLSLIKRIVKVYLEEYLDFTSSLTNTCAKHGIPTSGSYINLLRRLKTTYEN